MHTVHPKLQDSVEGSIGQPRFAPNRNVSNPNGVPLNIVPYTGHLYHNDSYYPVKGYLPTTWYPNMIGQLHLPFATQVLASANIGYQQPFFHIENKINRLVKTKNFPSHWNYVAKSPFLSQNFLAMPYNHSEPAPVVVPDYPPFKQLWQEKPTTLKDVQKDVQTELLRKRAVQDIIAFNENLITAQGQSFDPHSETKDLDQRREISSTEVQKKRIMESEKVLDMVGQRSPILEQDKLLVSITSPESKNKEDQICISCLNVNKTSKSFKRKKKKTEDDITSEEEYISWIGWESENSESNSQKPNPNGRRPSPSVISEVSSIVSFQSKEGEFFIDSMLSPTPSQTELSDKSMKSSRTSTPAFQRSLSLATSVPDFVLKSQASSESNCELSESSYQKSVTMRLSTPELSSKFTVSKPLPFIVEPRTRENPWHIVRSKKKRKQHKPETIKVYNSSSSHLSERTLSNSPLETKKKRGKRKKKNNFKYSKPKKLKKAVTTKKVKLKCMLQSSSTTRKYNRQSSCDIIKEYLFGIIMWCRVKKSQS